MAYNVINTSIIIYAGQCCSREYGLTDERIKVCIYRYNVAVLF